MNSAVVFGRGSNSLSNKKAWCGVVLWSVFSFLYKKTTDRAKLSMLTIPSLLWQEVAEAWVLGFLWWHGPMTSMTSMMEMEDMGNGLCTRKGY
jgi:hypothetical protein